MDAYRRLRILMSQIRISDGKPALDRAGDLLSLDTKVNQAFQNGDRDKAIQCINDLTIEYQKLLDAEYVTKHRHRRNRHPLNDRPRNKKYSLCRNP